MSKKALTVAKPKSVMDRQLKRRSEMKLWEALPECTAYLRLCARGRVKPDRGRLQAIEMVLSRTIPTLARVHQSGQVDHNVSVDLRSIFREVVMEYERSPESTEVDWEDLPSENGKH